MERSLGHRAPVLWLLLPTMGGFVAARALPAGWGGGWWFVVAAAGVVLAAGASWRPRCSASGGIMGAAEPDCSRSTRLRGAGWAAGVVLAVAASACAYFQLRENRLAVWERLPAREAELVLEVERVFPAVAGRVTTTGLARIVAAPAVVRETVGRRVYFSVKAPAEEEVLPSARLRASGVLTPLARRAEAGFEGYLADAGVAFKFNRARWLGLERGASAYRRFCAAAARRFERILGRGLEDRPALRSIHVAMLLGSRAELSEEQRALFMNSGTMHLFAISGLHIAVIWVTLSQLLLALRVPRAAAITVGLPALLLYVEITGGAPSALRAWLMIAFVLVAELLRWARNPLAGIAASALVVLWWEPWQLFGMGFQMSYAVVLSLLLFGLPLDERWQRYWRPWRDRPAPEWGWWRHRAREAGAATITGAALAVAATLVSLPMTVAAFGVMTPGSLLVNLVCIPASSLAIVAGIGSILAGLLGLEPVSVFLNHASAVTIAAMEGGLAGAMALPGLHWPAQFRAEWAGAAVLVALLAGLMAGYAGKWGARRRGLWVPVATLAVLLVVLVRHGAPPEPAAPPGAAPGNLPAAAPATIAPAP